MTAGTDEDTSAPATARVIAKVERDVQAAKMVDVTGTCTASEAHSLVDGTRSADFDQAANAIMAEDGGAKKLVKAFDALRGGGSVVFLRAIAQTESDGTAALPVVSQLRSAAALHLPAYLGSVFASNVTGEGTPPSFEYRAHDTLVSKLLEGEFAYVLQHSTTLISAHYAAARFGDPQILSNATDGVTDVDELRIPKQHLALVFYAFGYARDGVNSVDAVLTRCMDLVDSAPSVHKADFLRVGLEAVTEVFEAAGERLKIALEAGLEAGLEEGATVRWNPAFARADDAGLKRLAEAFELVEQAPLVYQLGLAIVPVTPQGQTGNTAGQVTSPGSTEPDGNARSTKRDRVRTDRGGRSTRRRRRRRTTKQVPARS